MRCMVCGKEYEGAGCPRCHFPNVQVPGDPEAAMKTLRPAIEKYRETVLDGIEIGVLIYDWKDKDGVLQVAREERRSFGTGKELCGKDVWLPQQFARIPERRTLPVKVYVRVGNQERLETVEIPNLMEAQLQQIGVSLDRDFMFCLMLRNDTGVPTRSKKISIFNEGT